MSNLNSYKVRMLQYGHSFECEVKAFNELSAIIAANKAHERASVVAVRQMPDTNDGLPPKNNFEDCCGKNCAVCKPPLPTKSTAHVDRSGATLREQDKTRGACNFCLDQASKARADLAAVTNALRLYGLQVVRGMDDMVRLEVVQPNLAQDLVPKQMSVKTLTVKLCADTSGIATALDGWLANHKAQVATRDAANREAMRVEFEEYYARDLTRLGCPTTADTVKRWRDADKYVTHMSVVNALWNVWRAAKGMK
jgi:hypothetical protein